MWLLLLLVRIGSDGRLELVLRRLWRLAVRIIGVLLARTEGMVLIHFDLWGDRYRCKEIRDRRNAASFEGWSLLAGFVVAMSSRESDWANKQLTAG